MKGIINVNPIRRGGFLSKTVKDYAIKYLDGYSICDRCQGILEKVNKPPICKIGKMLLQHYPMENSILTFGARESIALVTQNLLKPCDKVLVDQNRHYSTVLGVEAAGAEFDEVENSGHPEYSVAAEKFESILKNQTNKEYKLIILTHVDGNWGNVTDVNKISEIAEKYNIPILLNAAYSAGRYHFNPKEYNLDFVVISGHKSFGSSGPIGALLYKDKWKDIIEKPSTNYPNKNLNILGCNVRGTASAAFYQALKELPSRLNRWEKEIDKTRYFVEKMESIVNGGIIQIGERPKNHDLIYFETPALFDISQKHRKRGFFLASELKKRGIVGLKPGRTKGFKISVYGLSNQEIDYIINSFKEIIHDS